MMKDTKTEKDKLHRYLDDLYTRDDASQLLQVSFLMKLWRVQTDDT
jgi:hypothetical protein